MSDYLNVCKYFTKPANLFKNEKFLMSAAISTALYNNTCLTVIINSIRTSKSRNVKMLLQLNDAVTHFLLFQNLFLAIKRIAAYLRKHRKCRDTQNFIPPESLNGSFQPFSALTHTFLKAIRITMLYFNIFSQHALNTFHVN